VASNPEVGELVVAHIFASTSVQNQGAVMFSKLVSERTNGTYKLDVYPAAQLGNMNDILEQQKSGDIHMQIISSVALANISAFCFIDSWPYMFENQAQWEKAYKSDAVKEWIERCEKDSGFYLLAPTYKGFRHFYVNKEIKTLRDLAGIKIRCSGSPPEMDKFRVWGMAPTAMSSTEVFAAMQQGVVDAYEQELPVAADESIPEVTKTVVLTHHTAANYIWPVYQNWLNSMPADFQKTYREIARECSDFITKTIVDLEKPALQKFIDAGAKVIEPDMTEWAKISDTTYAANWPDLAYYALRIKEAGK
jgi:tripartite ATP-independent transporter DctP family solute receptor